MFQRIFINVMLCPMAIGSLLSPFIMTRSEHYHWSMPLWGIALVAANINWCRNHLWHKPESKKETEEYDSISSKSIYEVDDISVPEIGSTLKRGVNLRK